jgi:hypothetical protein
MSLSLSKEHGLRVFGYRVLNRIFGPKKKGVIDARENIMMLSFLTHCPSHILLERWSQGKEEEYIQHYAGKAQWKETTRKM